MSNQVNYQSVYEVFEHQKKELFLHLLDILSDTNSVLVFVRTREALHAITAALHQLDVRVESIQGNKKPEIRDRAIRMFGDGKIRVLSCTDAVARDLEIRGASRVVNYDFPEVADDYMQRVKFCELTGAKMITFVTPKDRQRLQALEERMQVELPRKIADGFSYADKPVKVKPKRNKSGKSKGVRSKPLQNKKPKLKNKYGS